jgi:hypothetical protein
MSELIVQTLWIYGLAAVVSLLIAAVIKLIVVLLNRYERVPTPPVAAGARSAAGPAPVSAEHLAVIAAAVYAAMGEHRIVHIEHGRRGADWAAGGRQAHHASHAQPPRQAKR